MSADEAKPPTEAAPGDTQSGWTFAVLFRMAVGLCGLVGFAIGVRIAWHTANSTTLLIVSGVLLVLAALGLDWDEIRGEYAGATVQLLKKGLRTTQEQLGRVSDEVAADPEKVPESVRTEIEAVRSQVEALASAAEKPSRRVAKPTANMNQLIELLLRTTTTHTFPAAGQVQLSLQMGGATGPPVVCKVKTPSGSEYTRQVENQPNLGALINRRYVTNYPEDFAGSEPLGPGRYEVEWLPGRALTSNVSPIISALAQRAAIPIATDAFTIPDATDPARPQNA